jgi:hypothetical protein
MIQRPASLRVIFPYKDPCIANVFSSITNKMQRYTIHLFLQNALRVSGCSSAHHQELSWRSWNCSTSSTTTAKGSSNGLTNTRCCVYSFWAPDDGRRNRLKHVEHFAEINEMCNVAFRRLYLKIKKKGYFFRFHHSVPPETICCSSGCWYQTVSAVLHLGKPWY